MNFLTKKIYTFLQAMFHSPLIFTWKPVIWNHSVLQVLGIRWKWRMLSCPTDFNPILFWLSYFKWRSLTISLSEKLHKNFIKENKISFLFIFLFSFCEQGKWLPCRMNASREWNLCTVNFKANWVYLFMGVRTIIFTNIPPCSIIKLTASTK